MRSFEVLCAALFTLDATGSGLAVAVVIGRAHAADAAAGCLRRRDVGGGDRKRILLVGQIMAGTGSATIAVLAAFGVAQPWHVGVAALLAGIVWSTEMSTRRRMVGECVEGAMVPRALAFDTVTNSITRLVGPIAGWCRVSGRWGSPVPTRYPLWSMLVAIILVRWTGIPAGRTQDRAVACASRPRRSVHVRPWPRDHRWRARGHHRDEPAGVLLLCAGRADRATGVHGIADADRHARRRRGVRCAARRVVAHRRRTAPERTHADGRRIAVVPGLRDR